MIVKGIQAYTDLKYNKLQQNRFQYVTSERVSDDVVVCHYHGYLDKKYHKVKILENNVVTKIGEEKMKDIIDCLDKRNHIVHCSLMGEDEHQMLDLTTLFREFVYHFDKDDDMSRLEHFFEYVKMNYDLDKFGQQADDLYFVVYMNDNNFTEVKSKVKEITAQQFRDLLNIDKHEKTE